MNNLEIAREIRAQVTEIEARLAKIDALATTDFRAAMNADLVAKAESGLARAVKGVKAMHRAMDKAVKSSDVISPQFGK